jgi:hypothetical protein
MPFSHSIAKNAGFVSRLLLTELSFSQGALTGRLRAVALVLACLLVGLAPYQLQAQTLSFLNNYFVTGDHIVRDFQYSNTANGYNNGTITIPGAGSGNPEAVPEGAEVVAAFLYWQVLEPTVIPSPDPGSSALFNGYSITGDVVGSDQSACGRGIALVRSYRADVLPYLPVGVNGNSQAVGTHNVGLPLNPNGSPSLPGASLVIVYRVLSGAPWAPLRATVIYDGSLRVDGPVIPYSLNLPIAGFYDAVSSNGTDGNNKITDIWGAVGYDGSNPASLLNFTSYTSAKSVADHASQIIDNTEYGVSAQTCTVFTTSVFTTRVNSGDGDGLLDAWKTNHGYCDVSVNPGACGGSTDPSWVDLPGATPGEKDIFVQFDYMYAVDHSHEPRGAALSMVTNAFLKQNIHLHFVAGNFIPEDTCTDDLTQTPPVLCVFPNEPGVVAWKLGLEAFKAWPTKPILNTDPLSCTGGVCTPRFQPGRKDSYHYLLIGHSLALPTWSVADPIYTLKSIQVSNGNATVTTSATLTSCPSRVTIDGAIATPNLNGVYTTITCPSPLNTTFTISNINANKTLPYTVADGPYPNTLAEPYLAVYTSVTDSTSGYSDIGGGDIAVTLGKWTWEEGLPAENQIGGECFTSDTAVSPQCENGLAGTLMHELGHNLTLLHGGRFYPGSNTTPEPSFNCKPNYQSVMNYLFQVDLLQSDAQGDRVLDYSSQALDPLDENNLSATPGITPASQYPYTKWFAPSPPFLTLINNPPPAPAYHCDGTPNSTNETAYEMEGLANPIAWSNGWDINFDGGLEVLDGYGNNDWSIIDPRQVGASGNDNVGGTIYPTQVDYAYQFGSYFFGPNGGMRAGGGGGMRAGGGGGMRAGGGGGMRAGGGGGMRAGGGGGMRAGGGGGVGEPNYPKIDSYPRPPRAVTASGGLVAWKPATFGNIVQYNVYRVNGPSSTLIGCVYLVSTPPATGCPNPQPGDPYAASYSYADSGAPANSTYLVTTVDLGPAGNQRESTPQGVGAFQAPLIVNATPLTYGSSETLTTTGGSTGGLVTYYVSGPCSIANGNQLTANSGSGSCSVTATMASNNNYNPVTSAVLIISLQKANATITVTPYSVTYDGNAHTATGTATGVKGESLNGLNLSATTHTAAGVYNDTWTFTDGTGNYNNASGTVFDTITQSSTATALSATPNPANFGQSVSLQATVTPIPPGTGTPTGTVTFKDGVTPLSTVTMSSAAASFVTSSLAPGTHNLTASYSGDANFSQSSSAVLAEQIVCGLLLSISPSTVKQGGTVTVAAKLISCSTSAQTVVVKFTLSGPLQPNSCSSKKTDIFTTPPFTLPRKTSKSISFPFPILKRTCTGTYTITATTLVNGTAVNTSTASLTITSQ